MNKPRLYIQISGTIFGTVAVLHILRILAGWDITVGHWDVSVAASFVVALGTGAMAFWALQTAKKI